MMITTQMDIENTLDIVLLHLDSTLNKIDISKTDARLIAYNEIIKYGIDKFLKNESSIIVSTIIENTMNSLMKHNISEST